MNGAMAIATHPIYIRGSALRRELSIKPTGTQPPTSNHTKPSPMKPTTQYGEGDTQRSGIARPLGGEGVAEAWTMLGGLGAAGVNPQQGGMAGYAYS